jgi:hypothetical protein
MIGVDWLDASPVEVDVGRLSLEHCESQFSPISEWWFGGNG